jgi:UDP-glucose-4-epimerase GalE
MTVLVTGGAGYIGSHTVKLLQARGRPVVVLDDLSTGHAALVHGAPLVVGRVQDHDLVASVVAEHGVDACIHFAASKAAGESVRVPEQYFANNTCGALALLDALVGAGVHRFVFSSTAAVYGTPATLPVAEDHALHPESPYGESKLLVERMLPWLEGAHGLRSVSLRYFNAAGAAADGSVGEDYSVTTNLVPLVMKALLGRSAPLQVFGTDYPTPDGTCVRDYVHVDDLADAHLAALEHLERGGESVTLNLGTGVGSTVLEVLAAAEQASGRPVPHTLAARRPGDPTALFADNARARELLGWTPTRSLQEIVRSAWAWHSAHPDGPEG